MTDRSSFSENGSWRQIMRDGMVGAWPICLGYVPIGMALGVLARQAGLTPFDIGLMSLLVFAGSAQFICVAMIGEGASALSIILTTFVINFRHVLMSSSLAPHLYGVRRSFLALFAYGVTDESYAINMTRFRQGGWDHWRALVLHHSANTTWFVASVTGALAGSLIPQGAFGLDFALPAMFLALLVYQFQNRIHIITALIAAVVSVTCYLTIPGDGFAVIAAIVAATCGYLLQRRRDRGEGRMNYPDYLYLLIGMGVVTYGPRMLPLVVLANRKLPQGVIDWLNFIPVAILSALVAPGLFTESTSRSFALGRLELLVAIPTLVFALKTRSLGGTVVFGMFLYWLGGILIT